MWLHFLVVEKVKFASNIIVELAQSDFKIVQFIDSLKTISNYVDRQVKHGSNIGIIILL